MSPIVLLYCSMINWAYPSNEPVLSTAQIASHFASWQTNSFTYNYDISPIRSNSDTLGMRQNKPGSNRGESDGLWVLQEHQRNGNIVKEVTGYCSHEEKKVGVV